jgi:hypothetical protein
MVAGARVVVAAKASRSPARRRPSLRGRAIGGIVVGRGGRPEILGETEPGERVYEVDIYQGAVATPPGLCEGAIIGRRDYGCCCFMEPGTGGGGAVG